MTFYLMSFQSFIQKGKKSAEIVNSPTFNAYHNIQYKLGKKQNSVLCLVPTDVSLMS